MNDEPSEYDEDRTLCPKCGKGTVQYPEIGVCPDCESSDPNYVG
jgi:uncharacterized OB-fold protein